MEVHHHPQSHERKNWKAYFWEFLMLFLAVYCGFLAENWREHIVEHQREKEYIKSFVEDLKQDTAQLNVIVKKFDRKLAFHDSLLQELANPMIFKSSSRAHYFFEMGRHFPDYIYTDRTIQQLKNGGGMRLIRNKAVSDSIVDYDSKVRILAIAQAQMNDLVLTFGLEKNKLFQNRLLDTLNHGFHNPPIALLSQNRTDLEEFYNNMNDQRAVFRYMKGLDEDLLKTGTRTIEFIKKEYHLQ